MLSHRLDITLNSINDHFFGFTEIFSITYTPREGRNDSCKTTLRFGSKYDVVLEYFIFHSIKGTLNSTQIQGIFTDAQPGSMMIPATPPEKPVLSTQKKPSSLRNSIETAHNCSLERQMGLWLENF